MSQFEDGFEDIVVEGTDEGCGGVKGVGYGERDCTSLDIRHIIGSRFFDHSERLYIARHARASLITARRPHFNPLFIHPSSSRNLPH